MNKFLGLAKELDPVLKAHCDHEATGVTMETLSAKTAELMAMPAGEVGHFQCALKGDIGLVKWDIVTADSGVYSVSIFGDAIKPGTKWSQNHFARLGATFAKPFLTPDGQKKLDQSVEEYASKEPEVGVRWSIDNVVMALNDVMGGEQKGKWVMSVMPDHP